MLAEYKPTQKKWKITETQQKYRQISKINLMTEVNIHNYFAILESAVF